MLDHVRAPVEDKVRLVSVTVRDDVEYMVAYDRPVALFGLDAPPTPQIVGFGWATVIAWPIADTVVFASRG